MQKPCFMDYSRFNTQMAGRANWIMRSGGNRINPLGSSCTPSSLLTFEG